MHLHFGGVFTICFMLTLFCAVFFPPVLSRRRAKLNCSSFSVKLVVFTCLSVHTASVFSFLLHSPHVIASLQSEENESLIFESPVKSLRMNLL